MRSFSKGVFHPDSRAAFAPLFSDTPHPVVLAAANTLYRHAIPAGARIVSFSFNGDFWATSGAVTDVIVIPSASGTAGAGEFCPTQREIPEGATHILLIAESAIKGSLNFWGS